MTLQPRSRSPLRARTARRGVPLTASLGLPFSWYDAHLGGSSTQISDISGNGRAAVTYGAAASAPLSLPFTPGVPYVHLEAAAAGTNSISCTAPAGTETYSAAPLSGGAATTGAATPGAFAFTTDGDWKTVTLLDSGAVELAKFDAALTGQTGHTDSHTVAWAINRGTAGRKSTLVNRRSLVLLGTNDQLLTPIAAYPAMTITDSATIILVARSWATFPASARWLQSATAGGRLLVLNGVSPSISFQQNDGTNSQTVAAATTLGARSVLRLDVAGRSATGARIQVNGGTQVTASNVSVGDLTPTQTGGLGSVGNGAAQNDMEIEAFMTFNRTIADAEFAQVVSYYGGGS